MRTGPGVALARLVQRLVTSHQVDPRTFDPQQAASDARPATGLGYCPACRAGHIRPTPKGYGCSRYKDAGCRFTIWGEIAGRQITPSDVRLLLLEGRTPILTGFRSTRGKTFDAALVLAPTTHEVHLTFQAGEAHV